MNDTTPLKHSRTTGAARTALAAQFKAAYEGGTSLRSIAEEAGRSYGFVHRVLSESGVVFRARSGRHRPATD
ncbi:helix-turn-helix domain-containing protein [Streptomyces sp. NPDC057910]|uniref:helix-turn-helix domain-containing protein n=1 Tax=Streptomyces sp. NPDC057910 TaxID=3346278 RepID=UPI0036E92381